MSDYKRYGSIRANPRTNIVGNLVPRLRGANMMVEIHPPCENLWRYRLVEIHPLCENLFW